MLKFLCACLSAIITLICSLSQVTIYLIKFNHLTEAQFFLSYGWLLTIFACLSFWLFMKWFPKDEDNVIEYLDYIKWFYWSRYPIFWYWIWLQARKLWSMLIPEQKITDPKIDWIACIGIKRYYNTLNSMIAKTGRNIYGDKLDSQG
jgi:hypothetical protein